MFPRLCMDIPTVPSVKQCAYAPKLFPAPVEISTRFVTGRQPSACHGGEGGTECFPDVTFADVIQSLAPEVDMSTRSGEKRQEKITSVSEKDQGSVFRKSAVGQFCSAKQADCNPGFTQTLRICSKFRAVSPLAGAYGRPFFSEVTCICGRSERPPTHHASWCPRSRTH